MDCRIEDLNEDGRGRAHVDGRTVLASQALPGELIRLRPDLSTRGTIQGRVARLIQPAAERIAHECAHEFHCTGCPLVAAERAFELNWKQDKLRAVCRELTGNDAVLEPMRSPGSPFGYRYFAKQMFGRAAGRTVLGSFVMGTHHVTSNRGCPVHAAPLQAVLDAVADLAEEMRLPVDGGAGRPGLTHVLARQSRATGAIQIVLGVRNVDTEGPRTMLARLREQQPSVTGVHVLFQAAATNVLAAGELVFSDGAPCIEEELLGLRHQIGPLEFFQVNPESAEVLFQRALDALGHGGEVLDLYAGGGVLSLPLLQRFASIHSVEADASACARLRERAAQDGLAGLRVHCGRVEDVLEEILMDSPATAALCDPPRKGLGPRVRELLARSGLQRVVLLACSPDSLLKDVPAFLAERWRVQCVAGVDQFPRTGHVEALCLLERD